MWYNAFIKALLRSPAHGLMSKNTMLITYTGRKSGKTYTIRVNYVRQGDNLLVTSYRHRTWWRNLRGGVPVRVRVHGADLQGVGEVITDDDQVTAGLQAYLGQVPQWSKYFQVGLDPDGQPDLEDVSRAAKERVIVRVHVTPVSNTVS